MFKQIILVYCITDIHTYNGWAKRSFVMLQKAQHIFTTGPVKVKTLSSTDVYHEQVLIFYCVLVRGPHV